jgi:hypothetical protein
MHIVDSTFACVTRGSIAPGVHRRSGSALFDEHDVEDGGKLGKSPAVFGVPLVEVCGEPEDELSTPVDLGADAQHANNGIAAAINTAPSACLTCLVVEHCDATMM